MANLTETSTYEAGIYQLERTDPVDAGTSGSGISNLQAKQLANRTKWLKDNLDPLLDTSLKLKGEALQTSTTINLTSADYKYLQIIDATSTAIVTCPPGAVADEGKILIIYNQSNNPVIIQPDGTDTFEPGGGEVLIAEGDYVHLMLTRTVIGMASVYVWITIGKRIKTDFVPAGTVIAFAKNTPPAGYVECNGGAISRTTYAALFAVIGTTFGVGDGSTTFNLPDLRGEFIRGWDNSRGVDTGRVFGSTQTEQVGAHSHNLYTQSGGDITNSGSTTYATTSGNSNSSASVSTLDNSGTENRPRNVALLYAIKY